MSPIIPGRGNMDDFFKYGAQRVSTPENLNSELPPVQNFAFGGIANPSQSAMLRSADKSYLEARQAELDKYEKERLAYNDALTKWQTEIYNPYKAQVDAYNAAADKYNTEVYNPYKAQVDAYNAALDKYNTEVYNPYKTQYDAYEKAVNEWNAGERTSDYAGPAAPTLSKTFDMTAPTTPKAFEMTAPTAPEDFKNVAPTMPFKEEDVRAYQQEAASRARKDASNRAVAIDVVSNPEQFNFGSMSVAHRFMAKGGEVMDDSHDKTARSIIKDFEGFGYTPKEMMELADEVAAKGRGGDELLAYLSPQSVEFLKAHGGSGTINPVTGLPEFKGGIIGSIVNAVKSVFGGGSDSKAAPAATAAPAPTAPTPTTPAVTTPTTPTSPTTTTAAEDFVKLTTPGKPGTPAPSNDPMSPNFVGPRTAAEQAAYDLAQLKAATPTPPTPVRVTQPTPVRIEQPVATPFTETPVAPRKPVDDRGWTSRTRPITTPTEDPNNRYANDVFYGGPAILKPEEPNNRYANDVFYGGPWVLPEEPKTPTPPAPVKPKDQIATPGLINRTIGTKTVTGGPVRDIPIQMPNISFTPINATKPLDKIDLGGRITSPTGGRAGSGGGSPGSRTTPQTPDNSGGGSIPIYQPTVPNYTNRGVGSVGTIPIGGNISMPMFNYQSKQTAQATNPSNYFGLSQPSMPGISPGTTALGPADLPLYGAKNTMNAIGSNPNLSPTMLGGVQNAGVMTDRLGNRIYSPGAGPLFGYAKGGGVDVAALMAQNAETLSDEKPEESINTNPVGTAQQYLADLTGNQDQTSYSVSPNQIAVKRVRSSQSPGGTAKEMAMQYESLTKGDLGAMKDFKPKIKDTDSARAQMEELARQYKIKLRSVENKAKGLATDTFGAPTLEAPTLMKNSLAKKRFEKGGEAKKEQAGEGEPSLFGVSDYATRAAERMFPNQSGQDDQRDAARHMLAAGMVARKTSPGVAEFLGKAHERLSSPQSFFNMFGIGEPRYDYDVDVHNNRIGAELAARSKSQQELEALVRQMALQSQNKQVPGKPWTMTREQLEAVDAKNKKAATPPEYRADGSPKEGEVSDAELEAASRPAFVTPKSGKGRKEGPISRALNSGEAYSAMAQGAADTPYNLVGAPVDIATMLMRPLGYNVDKPVMGSDWIKEKMTSAGVRPATPTDSTQKGFHTAGELLAGLVNPAGATRTGVRTVQRAGQAASDVAKDFQDYNRQLVVPGASYVSRAPGGYFPTSRANEGGILSNLDKTLEPVLKSVKEIDDPAKREALSMMFNQKAKDFFTKQAGSIQDPLRADILSGALRFDDASPMGDVFPRTLQKNVAQGDLQALRLLEKNYDKMIGIKSVVPRRLDADLVENVPESQIMAHMQANLDKIPDAQLLAYAGKKPGPGPTGVAEAAAQVREKLQANPALFSTVLEPRIAKTLFPQAQYVTDTDMARYPSLYGTAASEAMTIDHSLQPQTYADKVAPGYFLPDMEKAIEKGQPIMDVYHDRLNLLGMNANKLLAEAIQMSPEELNQMGFADFLKKAYANTQQVDKFESALPKVKKMIQEGKAPPADIMTYGMKDFLPTAGDFRWVKVIKPDGVRAIAAGMNNSVGSYANSTTYGSLNKGRAALDQGEAEIYSLYDKNNVPHVTVEYLTSKPGVPDNKKNTIAQLTGNGPLTGNEIPENYAPQIVDLLNNLRPSTMPLSIKRLLDKTGQKNFLTEEALAPLYFGVPIDALRAQDDNLLRQLGAR